MDEFVICPKMYRLLSLEAVYQEVTVINGQGHVEEPKCCFTQGSLHLI